jgi:predicted signal transduction protein with EAL and GGDEF domain
MGDVLLQQVAIRATGALRPGDVLARLGGDEFAILLPNAVTTEEASIVGERVLAAVAEPITLADVEISVGMSIGISLAPRHGVETSGLMKRADLAMYAAKATNRGVRLWDSGMGRTDTQQLTIAGELRRALEAGEIEIHAQPIASLVSGAVTAVQILPRWQHAERGLLMPDEFMTVAATSGLASELTRHLISAALEAGTRWRARGAELGLVVNLPARAFADASTPETVSGLLETHEFPARLLTLEINESSVVTEQKRALPYLKQLVELGVKIGVDGFGNGHPAITQLRRMPIGQVRINERFVHRADRDSSDEAIVRSIIELAGKFGVEVVAEGVDGPREWETLRRLGCPQAQGAWLARPLPVDEFWDWMCNDDPRARRLLDSGRLPQARESRDTIDVDELRSSDPLRGKAS